MDSFWVPEPPPYGLSSWRCGCRAANCSLTECPCGRKPGRYASCHLSSIIVILIILVYLSAAAGVWDHMWGISVLSWGSNRWLSAASSPHLHWGVHLHGLHLHRGKERRLGGLILVMMLGQRISVYPPPYCAFHMSEGFNPTQPIKILQLSISYQFPEKIHFKINIFLWCVVVHF